MPAQIGKEPRAGYLAPPGFRSRHWSREWVVRGATNTQEFHSMHDEPKAARRSGFAYLSLSLAALSSADGTRIDFERH